MSAQPSPASGQLIVGTPALQKFAQKSAQRISDENAGLEEAKARFEKRQELIGAGLSPSSSKLPSDLSIPPPTSSASNAKSRERDARRPNPKSPPPSNHFGDVPQGRVYVPRGRESKASPLEPRQIDGVGTGKNKSALGMTSIPTADLSIHPHGGRPSAGWRPSIPMLRAEVGSTVLHGRRRCLEHVISTILKLPMGYYRVCRKLLSISPFPR